VSITAVFLALGIGVALGSTLIQRATVDTLEGRLDEQSARLDATDGENAQLRAELDARAERDAELLVTAPPRVFADRVTDVPVLVIATRGTDADLVADVRRGVRDADAALAGTLWVTERWSSPSAADVAELSEITGITFSDPGVARRVVARLVAGELAAASVPPAPSEGEPGAGAPADGSGAEDPASPEGEAADPTSPPPAPSTALIESLAAAGFFELEVDRAGPLLAGGGARYVMVAGDPDEIVVPDSVVLVTMLRALAETGSSATVVAGIDPTAEVGPGGESQPVANEEGDVGLVVRVRADPVLAPVTSTADTIDQLVGRTALVLALEDLGIRRYGHYGTGAGAVSLLPPPLP